jgi:HSP20 family protein
MIPWQEHSLRQDAQWNEHPFDTLLREVNELFDAYRGSPRNRLRRAASAGWELSETADEIRVKAELPGVDKKGLQVTVEENVLTIHGEYKKEKETKKRNYHVSEMNYGGYHRTVPLPAEVDAAKARARFKHGVLTLDLPKTERGKSTGKRIPASAG